MREDLRQTLLLLFGRLCERLCLKGDDSHVHPVGSMLTLWGLCSPFGVHVHSVGPCSPCGGYSHPVGSMLTLWGPCSPYGSRVHPVEGHVHPVRGHVDTVGSCSPCGSHAHPVGVHVHPVGSIFTLWDPCWPSGGHVHPVGPVWNLDSIFNWQSKHSSLLLSFSFPSFLSFFFHLRKLSITHFVSWNELFISSII